MKSNKQILTEFMENAIKGIQAEIVRQGKYVTGETSRSMRHITTETESALYGSISLLALEYGRGPSKSAGGGSGERLIDQIRRWVIARGINDPDRTQESIAWAITTKIHKEGTAQYGKQPSGIISNVINKKSLDKLTDIVTANEINRFREIVLRQQNNV